jgi:broad specificity phosphatase PhoE/ribonuclease HI
VTEAGSAAHRSVIIEADGGSRGNPGAAGYGAVVFDAVTGDVLAERFDYIGLDTNNVAEYRGLIAGLLAAQELGASEVVVRMDSKLVIEQMSGRWQIKHAAMRRLAHEAEALLAGFPETRFEWIPREANKHADHLANRAMDIGQGKPVRPTRPGTAPAASVAVARAPATVPAAPASWTPPVGVATRIILVRHGSTEHSPQMRFSGRNQLPLSELGERQAAALARRAASFGQVAVVVSSPLPRARQTATAIADALGCPLEESDGLIETDFGDWEGLTGDEVRARWPAEHAAWLASVDVAPPGGETFSAVAQRVRRARDQIIAAHPGQTVVAVSHVTPIKTLLMLALDAPLTSMFRLHLDTASISRTDYYPNGASSVRLVNETTPLDVP